jgi:tetratricopeptide (TPR) repeat protein
MGYPARLLVAGASAVLMGLAGCATQLTPADIASEYHNLGNGFYDLKQYDKAIQYYELALERNPGTPGTRWNLTLAYYRRGRFADAEAVLMRRLEEDPEAIEAREVLALVYRGQDRYEEALSVLDEVLEIAPEDTNALNNKAIILWGLGRLTEATETLTQYLRYEPYSPDALYNLMLIAEEQGMRQRAFERAEEYLSVAKPSDADPERVTAANLVLARAYEREEAYYRALEIYGRMIEDDEDQPEAWFGQAAILLTSVEDPVRGLNALERALSGGFRDRERLALLLARDDLLDREEVEALLTRKEIRPGSGEIEAAQAGVRAERSPVVAEPTGPWAEPGVVSPPSAVPVPPESGTDEPVSGAPSGRDPLTSGAPSGRDPLTSGAPSGRDPLTPGAPSGRDPLTPGAPLGRDPGSG